MKSNSFKGQEFELVGICRRCEKGKSRYKQGCAAFKYVSNTGVLDCSAFTDDPDWERKLNQEVTEYAIKKGEFDYIPLEAS